MKKYVRIPSMKINVIISILFAIVTTFTALHEVEHLVKGDDSSCLVCHVNDNLVSADVIDEVKSVDIFHFEKISLNNQISNPHIKKQTNQDRAPPLTS